MRKRSISILNNTISLAGDYYFISVYVPNPENPPQLLNVSVTISGQTCANNQVWVNDTCQNVTSGPVSGNFSNIPLSFYYHYVIPSFPTVYKSYDFDVKTPNGSKYIFTSYGQTPTPSLAPVKDASMTNPASGDLYVLYQLNGTDGTPYQIDQPNGIACPNNSFVGNNCDQPLTPVGGARSTLYSTTISNMTWQYYTINVVSSDPTTALWVTAAPATPSANLGDFSLYVRKGGLPSQNESDFVNCHNVPNCGTFAYSIVLNNTLVNNTYYIGIFATKTTTYGIWFNSICPPGCINDNESGDCTWSGGSVGKCICQDGYMGLDCTQSTGILPTQYIVLIIIASLVVLSALIGFFAWAYMQRKREGYSSLT
jgi:hypothetical protein